MPALLDDAEYAATVEREFTHVVVEHHMKWGPMCSNPQKGSMWGGPQRKGRCWTQLSGCYDFGPSDRVVDWALARGLAVKGHVLLWHVTSPPWLAALGAEQLREALRRHVFTVLGHFRGRVESWDVANECLAPDGSLADTIFLRKLGPHYLDDVFRWAREAAGPGVPLIYNENKAEGARPDGAGGADARYCEHFYRKSDALYALLRGMRARGVPVDAVGLQAHFTAAGVGLARCPTPVAVAHNVRRLGALGLRVCVSEMDVRVATLPAALGGGAARDAAQAQIYGDVLRACAREDAFEGVTFWGFCDTHSWVHRFYERDAPLLFDSQYRPKAAWRAVLCALQGEQGQGQGQGQGARGPGASGQQPAGVCGDAAPWGSRWMQPEPEPSGAAEAIRGEMGGADSGATGDERPDWVLEQEQQQAGLGIGK
eukprot:g4531.t1